MRFCSRCGLPLGGLTEWLATGGSLGVREPQAAQPLLRRKGVKQGAKLMFLSGVVFPLMFALSIIVDSPGPLLVSFVIFFAGLAMMLYSRLFGEDMFPSKTSQAQAAPLNIQSGPSAFLPSAQTPLNPFGNQKMRTAEMVEPPSVTDHTTKLLDRD
ncbi:MAG TPA: hypothetical protein VF735_21505 [Pyrinomonadaceae bacterium]